MVRLGLIIYLFLLCDSVQTGRWLVSEGTENLVQTSLNNMEIYGLKP